MLNLLAEATSSLCPRLVGFDSENIGCHGGHRYLSKRVQRYFGNEQREGNRGILASTAWRIVIWKHP